MHSGEGITRREVLNLSQAAEHLGCCDKTMRRLAQEIPHQRRDRRYFFLRSVLDAWAAGKVGVENAQA